jgi:hypothetical protein
MILEYIQTTHFFKVLADIASTLRLNDLVSIRWSLNLKRIFLDLDLTYFFSELKIYLYCRSARFRTRGADRYLFSGRLLPHTVVFVEPRVTSRAAKHLLMVWFLIMSIVLAT